MTRIDEGGPPIEVDEAAIERLARALDRDGVVAAYLIGSHATGRAGPLSDVDVAVWLDRDLSSHDRFQTRLQLMADSAETLGTNEVDVVVMNDAPPLLKHRALTGRRLLVDRDPKTRIRSETAAILEYLDTQPLRDELARGVRRRLDEGRFGRQ